VVELVVAAFVSVLGELQEGCLELTDFRLEREEGAVAHDLDTMGSGHLYRSSDVGEMSRVRIVFDLYCCQACSDEGRPSWTEASLQGLRVGVAEERGQTRSMRES
jgi:hypothetical protein